MEEGQLVQVRELYSVSASTLHLDLKIISMSGDANESLGSAPYLRTVETSLYPTRLVQRAGRQ